jgi:hypothetical protein
VGESSPETTSGSHRSQEIAYARTKKLASGCCSIRLERWDFAAAGGRFDMARDHLSLSARCQQCRDCSASRWCLPVRPFGLRDQLPARPVPLPQEGLVTTDDTGARLGVPGRSHARTRHTTFNAASLPAPERRPLRKLR